jgi:flavin-dependent dehydrogenase
MADVDCDVAIIGGGLAGLTLALQLRQTMPGLAITVLERSRLPPAQAAHKVGESTVEIGAHYLADTLGLRELLEQTQLRKFGLRLFFGAGMRSDLAETDELGASTPMPAVSYQIDRGRLERDLAELAAARDITVMDECVVRKADIDTQQGPHRLTGDRNGEPLTVQSRWTVDAGSRVALLKRSLGIGKDNPHRIASAWARLDTPIAVDDWSRSPSWQRICDRPRRLSTNHLMGPGYWVWIIPLQGERTSIGIVAEPDVYAPSTFNTFEKLCDWLTRHQPRLAAEVLSSSDKLMDFRFMTNLACDSEQVWSRQRWALTGEAGLFSDPFYSPGSDFIGISNTFICDMIRRERSGERISAHAAVYQQMYKSFFESTMSLYENQYPGFGDTRLMVVKTTWDYAYYWAVLTWLYFRGAMTDIDLLRTLQPKLIAMRGINKSMQAVFQQRAAERRQDAGQGRFFDQTEIPLLYELNAGLLEPGADPVMEFDENCARLERVSPMLLELLAGESAAGNCSLLGDLRARFD